MSGPSPMKATVKGTTAAATRRARSVTVAALQLQLSPRREENLARVEAQAREAAGAGAQVIVPSELYETPYFPAQGQDEAHFELAHPLPHHPTVERARRLAAELDVVFVASVFERAGPTFFNTAVVVDAGGEVLGAYRKSHIPDGPGYQEKFYFAPGDTGFRVWRTRFVRLGVGLCWDQWFPGAARAMALGGAEVLVYPTAIGTEPEASGQDTSGPWRRVMQGHAAASAVPVVAANRVGDEGRVRFYGQSFVTDGEGAVLAEVPDAEEGFALATFDLEALTRARAGWGFFRDRRPALYGALGTLDGGAPGLSDRAGPARGRGGDGRAPGRGEPT